MNATYTLFHGSIVFHGMDISSIFPFLIRDTCRGFPVLLLYQAA